jgi:hypothetical protein
MNPDAVRRSSQSGGSVGLARVPDVRGALVGAPVDWPPGVAGCGAVTAISRSDRELRVLSLPQAVSDRPFFQTNLIRLDPWTTLGYPEKVRSQFLSLRHRPGQSAIELGRPAPKSPTNGDLPGE